MDALIVTLFVSLVLASLGIGFLVWSVVRGTHDHDARLALLPLEEDAVHRPRPSPPDHTSSSSLLDSRADGSPEPIARSAQESP